MKRRRHRLVRRGERESVRDGESDLVWEGVMEGNEM